MLAKFLDSSPTSSNFEFSKITQKINGDFETKSNPLFIVSNCFLAPTSLLENFSPFRYRNFEEKLSRGRKNRLIITLDQVKYMKIFASFTIQAIYFSAVMNPVLYVFSGREFRQNMMIVIRRVLTPENFNYSFSNSEVHRNNWASKTGITNVYSLTPNRRFNSVSSRKIFSRQKNLDNFKTRNFEWD